MKFSKESTSQGTKWQHDFEDYQDRVFSYPPEKRTDKWSVSWSDLMMTMFIFFAVMYVFQTGNRDLLFGDGPGKNHVSESGSRNVVNMGATEHKPSNIYDQTRQAVSEVMLSHPNSVDLLENGAVRIVLAGDFLFDPGSAQLKLGARYQLDQIARVLSESTLFINVVGHTDDVPSRSERYPSNWDLSAERAVMVARYLTEGRGIDQKRVFVSAHASNQAVRPNDSERNRALNRRVEIILVKQMP